MATPDPAGGVSTERLRDAVATRIGAVGLRPVARELTLDPKAVTKFLGGARPRAATRQKLVRWYVQLVAAQAGATDAFAAAAAIEVLVRDLAPDQHPAASAELLQLLAQVYKRRDTPLPAWLLGLVPAADAAAGL
jgi:hypothetical protein